jgi:hypothetical protein
MTNFLDDLGHGPFEHPAPMAEKFEFIPGKIKAPFNPRVLNMC